MGIRKYPDRFFLLLLLVAWLGVIGFPTTGQALDSKTTTSSGSKGTYSKPSSSTGSQGSYSKPTRPTPSPVTGSQGSYSKPTGMPTPSPSATGSQGSYSKPGDPATGTTAGKSSAAPTSAQSAADQAISRQGSAQALDQSRTDGQKKAAEDSPWATKPGQTPASGGSGMGAPSPARTYNQPPPPSGSGLGSLAAGAAAGALAGGVVGAMTGGAAGHGAPGVTSSGGGGMGWIIGLLLLVGVGAILWFTMKKKAGS